MNAREITLLALQETEQKNMKSEHALDRLFKRHKPGTSDRALATELFNGTLRLQLKLDHAIRQYYHHDLEKAAPLLRNILRLGAYQLLFLNRVPDWAAVSESVKLARKYKGKHLAGMVNGVLRSMSSESGAPIFDIQGSLCRQLSIETSHPEWLVQRWLDHYGESVTKAMLAADNEPPLIALRINTLKTDTETMYKALNDASIPFSVATPEQCILAQNFEACEPFIRLGLLSVQNPTQALPCLLLNPDKGDTIIDMCAAPGGKASYLAELMRNEGTILAVDRYPNKCAKIAARAETMGISIIRTVPADARTFRPDIQPDALLLDAPCTGTGVLGKIAELRWRTSPEKLEELTSLQAELLDHAAELLKPGGILVYATCSVEPEENALQIHHFLERHPDFERESPPVKLPENIFQEHESAPGSFLTLPGQHEGYDGGFAQRLRKK